jgi:hypothetical protein
MEQPTLVTNGSGAYRLYDGERDQTIYEKELARDIGGSNKGNVHNELAALSKEVHEGDA